MKYLRPSMLLLVVAFLAYGLLIPQLGFYWDDLPITWIRYQLGAEALTKYFSTNRPVWGLLHQITTSILPQVPIYWQIFALLWRWLGAVIVYAIVTKLWKDKPQSALGVALLFLVYPGFNQQWAAYLYSHFYIVLFFFLSSILCMLLAMESPKRYWAWTGAGILFSALNLWMMEYFYVLELVRVGVILMAIRDESWTLRERMIRTLKLWSPYLGVFILSVLYRIFVFNNQVYGMGLTGQLKSAPVETVKALTQSIWLSLRLVLKNAWLQMFEFPNLPMNDSLMNSYYVVIVMVILLAAAGFLLMPRDVSQTNRRNLMNATWIVGLGALAVFLAGWPFWLIGFKPSLQWPASRFTLPFAFGVSLIFGGLIGAIPWEKLRIALLVSLVSLAAGKQYLTSHVYQQDWATQKEMFWQMTWRAPGLKPDTVVLLNEGALNYYADNSLSAALNWIYAPENHGKHIEYVLFYPKTRLGNAFPKLEKGLPVYFDYLGGEFHSSTSQTLVIYYAPPGCLRVLDADIEGRNRLIPETSLIRFAANISEPGLIINESHAKMPAVYGPEPAHDFCYYFERADLARQFGDWDMVVKYGESALSLDDHPYDPAEQFVFIEGYAHAGQWERAVDLSIKAHDFSGDIMGPMLCKLWRRIAAETVPSLEGSAALSQMQTLFGCNS